MKPLILHPERILVIRLGSLGDIVLSTLLLRCLRDRFPRATIDMLVKERYKPLLDSMDCLDGRLTYPERASGRRELRRLLRDAGYDTVVDLQNNLISRRIVQHIQAQRVFRYRRWRINRWFRIHFPSLRRKLTTPPPVGIGYLETAAPLSVMDDGRGLRLICNDRSLEAVRDILRAFHEKAGLPSETEPLILAPGSRHQTKVWLAERWVTLMECAREEGYGSQVLIGSDAEQELLEGIQSRLGFPVLMTAGRTGLGELTALISLGCALVSGDSGPMHIAGAVGTPVVAIFGPTVPEFGFAPFRCRSEVVQIADELTCRPCHPHGPERCPRKHFRCMLDIDPQMVMSAVKRVVSEGS